MQRILLGQLQPDILKEIHK
uniref:Uncharacterized protein n=1 Tax=Rhizophora mucronata TaxID=61149 RepID=A0A2P2R4C5_RHIMU